MPEQHSLQAFPFGTAIFGMTFVISTEPFMKVAVSFTPGTEEAAGAL